MSDHPVKWPNKFMIYRLDANEILLFVCQDGFTPLKVALQQGHKDVVRLLSE